MERTYIYLIHDDDTDYYKIGRSDNPDKRLQALRKEATLLPKPHNFTLVGAWLDDPKHEAQLHSQYEEKRVRGEWFELSEDDVDEISHGYFFTELRWKRGSSLQVEYLERRNQQLERDVSQLRLEIDLLQKRRNANVTVA